ncbi:hypothetical protein [Hymenobacter daeguensis]
MHEELAAQLSAYVDELCALFARELEEWYELRSMNLSRLGLATLYLLHKALDANEGKTVDERVDYLLVLPDRLLDELALDGALLGAMLLKYRANYIAASQAPTRYAVGDVMLRLKNDGESELREVHEVDATTGQIVKTFDPEKRRGRNAATTFYGGNVRNGVRLLSRQECKHLGLDGVYTHKQTRLGLAGNFRFIRDTLRIQDWVSAFPHRLGVLCDGRLTERLHATAPMPLRRWSSQGNPTLQLPVPPMVEAASSYERLKTQVFNMHGVPGGGPVEELLIMGHERYCDENGLFDAIRMGRNWGYYQNLLLVGSRPPRVAHPFRVWEWTPEEMALLQGQPVRYPELHEVYNDSLHQATVALQDAVELVEIEYGVNQRALLHVLPLLWLLTLPPMGTKGSEIERQTAALLLWAQTLLEDDGPYRDALLTLRPAEMVSTRQLLKKCLAEVADCLHHANAKYAALRELALAHNGRVVLVVASREVESTAAALKADWPTRKAPLVVSGKELREKLSDEKLNQATTLWILPALRIGKQGEDELMMYRRALRARGRVIVLAYSGLEAARYAQVELYHRRRVATALHHPDRPHFGVHIKLLELVESAQIVTATPAADTTIGPDSAAAAAIYSVLDELFGKLNIEEAQRTNLNTSLNSKQRRLTDEEPGVADERLQLRLIFTDNTEMRLAPSTRVLTQDVDGDWLLRRPGELLSGDRVIIVETDPAQVRRYLSQRFPAEAQAVQEAWGWWRNALRMLLAKHYYGSWERLYYVLTKKGLAVKFVRFEQWLTDENFRFPRLWQNLMALYDLAEEKLGASNPLRGRMDAVYQARRFHNREVARVNRQVSGPLLGAHLSGDDSQCRAHLGEDLYLLLRDNSAIRERTLLEVRPVFHH